MRRMKKIILLIILIVLGATGVKWFWETTNRVSLNLDYSESTNTIRNPERGWYLIHRCMVSNQASEAKSFDDNFLDQNERGDTLALVMFNIQEYRNGEISEEGLAYIDYVLEGVKKAGLKAIVRFVYDWDGYGIENEPENIEIILNHMEQLKSRFYSYQDSIYLVQGVFVGNYGEMHGSQYLDEESVSRLMNKLLESTPQGMMMSVRTPEYWRLICDRDEPIKTLSQLPGARIGLYNDGLCSSETDLGTYSDGTGYVSKWPREEEINFQSQLCRYTPNGGELALDSEYNDMENIIKEFPLLHISYLNRDYNMEVLDKWKTSTYTSDNSEDPYDGVDGFKYVQDHLGYRFVLRNVSVNKRIFLKSTSTIEIEIENTGFSNMYYAKDVKVMFRGVNTGDGISVVVDTDTQSWESGEMSKIKVLIPKNLKEDTYKVYIEISDLAGNKVQLANPNIYDDKLGMNVIGEINTQKLNLVKIWE